ncbi:MAG: peroxiredoxin [Acidobacteria bacterium]|nr:peroxiredoxin [Acidobacteriota bacterium]
MTLQPGDDAPDFELPSHRGGTVKLSDFHGKKNVVLAFHPLAFTPVCADQMCSYEADLAKFDAADTAVFGISIDPQPSKAAWARELGLRSFDLLSDNHPYGEVAKKYGVFREKEGFADRSVFVIDGSGTVRWSKVYDVPQHPGNEEIFEALAALGGS